MDFEKLAEQYLCSGSNVAVVGASLKKERTSFKIVDFLKRHGISVYPVNPAYVGKEIKGMPFYSSVRDLKEPVDIVDIVVSPMFQDKIVEDIESLGYRPIIWFQPGAENPKLEESLAEKGFKVISDACIMVVTDLFCSANDLP